MILSPLSKVWKIVPSFSVQKESLQAKEHLEIFKAFEEHRPHIQSLSLGHRQNILSCIQDAEAFVEKIKDRTFIALGSRACKKRTALYSKIAMMKLHICTLQKELEIETTAKAHEHTKASFRKMCHEWHQEVLTSRYVTAFNEKKFSFLESLHEELPGTSPDKEIVKEAIERCREAHKATGFNEEETVAGLIASKAERCYNDTIKQYEEYLPLLVEDRCIQGRFKKQVIRDELNPEVFFRHGFEADFLRRNESLERSVALARDSIRIGGESHLPEIKFQGKYIPVKDLPGYSDGTFKNMIGWYTLGLGKDFNPRSVKEMKQHRDDYANGYVYTASQGLIPWNPRAWEKRNEDGTWTGIDFEKESWWQQLTPYRIGEIGLEGKDDRGWRLIPVVTATKDDPQFVGTHSMLCVVIPLEKPSYGKVKVGYFPFGRFPYGLDIGMKVLGTTESEIHYPDQCIYTIDRSYTHYCQKITEEEGKAAMAEIKFMHLSSLKGKKAYPFNLYNNNCTALISRVFAVVKRYTPLQMIGYRIAETPLRRSVLKVVQGSAILKNIYMYLFSGREKGAHWDFILNHPYPLRKYLQLRYETERLEKRGIMPSIEERSAMPF
jgi:hypothetical protein